MDYYKQSCPLKVDPGLMVARCLSTCPWFIANKAKCAITVIAELMIGENDK